MTTAEPNTDMRGESVRATTQALPLHADGTYQMVWHRATQTLISHQVTVT